MICIKGWISNLLTFYILLLAKPEQKVIYLYFNNLFKCAKNWFFIKKYSFSNLCRGCLDCNVYFSYEKHAFIVLLNVSSIQMHNSG